VRRKLCSGNRLELKLKKLQSVSFMVIPAKQAGKSDVKLSSDSPALPKAAALPRGEGWGAPVPLPDHSDCIHYAYIQH